GQGTGPGGVIADAGQTLGKGAPNCHRSAPPDDGGPGRPEQESGPCWDSEGRCDAARRADIKRSALSESVAVPMILPSSGSMTTVCRAEIVEKLPLSARSCAASRSALEGLLSQSRSRTRGFRWSGSIPVLRLGLRGREQVRAHCPELPLPAVGKGRIVPAQVANGLL